MTLHTTPGETSHWGFIKVCPAREALDHLKLRQKRNKRLEAHGLKIAALILEAFIASAISKAKDK